MEQATIFLPFFGMVLLTLVVWVYMYVRRLTFIVGNQVDAQQFTTPEKASRIVPEEIQWPAHNFRNLLELPVIFYAICLYLYVTGSVDPVYLGAALWFVALRAVHSFVHCSTNIVKARFASYMLASLSLWFMAIRAAADAAL
jgi:hypothetical protein